jgi:hypothetical protein
VRGLEEHCLPRGTPTGRLERSAAPHRAADTPSCLWFSSWSCAKVTEAKGASLRSPLPGHGRRGRAAAFTTSFKPMVAAPGGLSLRHATARNLPERAVFDSGGRPLHRPGTREDRQEGFVGRCPGPYESGDPC